MFPEPRSLYFNVIQYAPNYRIDCWCVIQYDSNYRIYCWFVIQYDPNYRIDCWCVIQYDLNYRIDCWCVIQYDPNYRIDCWFVIQYDPNYRIDVDLLFRYECSNPIFGVTHNPHNITRSPGGSSGGEGALIGAGASILGTWKTWYFVNVFVSYFL